MKLERGQVSPVEMYHEGIQVACSGQSIQAHIAMSRPSTRDVRMVRRGRLKFAVLYEEPVIVLLFGFEDFTLQADFNANAGAYVRTESRVGSLSIVLQRVEDQKIVGLRSLGIKKPVMTALAESVEKQAAFSGASSLYNRMLSSLYAGYPDPQALFDLAVAKQLYPGKAV